MVPLELWEPLVLSRALPGCSRQGKICISADQIMRHHWLRTAIPGFSRCHLTTCFFLEGSCWEAERSPTILSKMMDGCFASAANPHRLHNQGWDRHCPPCNLECAFPEQPLKGPKYPTATLLLKECSLERQMMSSATSCN